MDIYIYIYKYDSTINKLNSTPYIYQLSFIYLFMFFFLRRIGSVHWRSLLQNSELSVNQTTCRRWKSAPSAVCSDFWYSSSRCTASGWMSSCEPSIHLGAIPLVAKITLASAKHSPDGYRFSGAVRYPWPPSTRPIGRGFGSVGWKGAGHTTNNVVGFGAIAPKCPWWILCNCTEECWHIMAYVRENHWKTHPQNSQA